MNSSPPAQITVLFVANTGHIVAALTRTDGSGKSPSVAGLVEPGLALRVPKTLSDTSSDSPGTFVIPSGDLSSVDVNFDLVGTYPWGRAIVLERVGTTPPGPTQSVVNSSLTAFPFPPSMLAPSVSPTGNTQATATIAGSLALPYYIVIAKPAAMTGALASASGVLAPAGTTSTVTLTFPPAAPGAYPVLILIQTMLPFVTTLTIR